MIIVSAIFSPLKLLKTSYIEGHPFYPQLLTDALLLGLSFGDVHVSVPLTLRTLFVSPPSSPYTHSLCVHPPPISHSVHVSVPFPYNLPLVLFNSSHQ